MGSLFLTVMCVMAFHGRPPAAQIKEIVVLALKPGLVGWSCMAIL